MKPTINDTEFGSITIGEDVFTHDVLIRLDGTVRKRKKDLSRAMYGTSHMVSLDEARHIYDEGAGRLIVGSGQNGMLALSAEAEKYFRDRRCDAEIYPTPEAIEQWNRADGPAIALFHVTC